MSGISWFTVIPLCLILLAIVVLVVYVQVTGRRRQRDEDEAQGQTQRRDSTQTLTTEGSVNIDALPARFGLGGSPGSRVDQLLRTIMQLQRYNRETYGIPPATLGTSMSAILAYNDPYDTLPKYTPRVDSSSTIVDMFGEEGDAPAYVNSAEQSQTMSVGRISIDSQRSGPPNYEDISPSSVMNV
ncbi:hypothetical protein HK102_006138 [Quaeritorhiza haematococci]|nr:hypothetical protein HK102_006138 [Quaeritorhiza haematococci]